MMATLARNGRHLKEQRWRKMDVGRGGGEGWRSVRLVVKRPYPGEVERKASDGVQTTELDNPLLVTLILDCWG